MLSLNSYLCFLPTFSFNFQSALQKTYLCLMLCSDQGLYRPPTSKSFMSPYIIRSRTLCYSNIWQTYWTSSACLSLFRYRESNLNNTGPYRQDAQSHELEAIMIGCEISYICMIKLEMKFKYIWWYGYFSAEYHGYMIARDKNLPLQATYMWFHIWLFPGDLIWWQVMKIIFVSLTLERQVGKNFYFSIKGRMLTRMKGTPVFYYFDFGISYAYVVWC
jgi:hypothetical protein